MVEDHRETRELFRGALIGAGYAVVAVEDGLDALRAMDRNRPAAVVLDLGLPRLHGSDVAQEMSAQPALQNVPVVVVTGQSTPLDPTRFSSVLHKPVDADALITAVAQSLQSRRPRPAVSPT